MEKSPRRESRAGVTAAIYHTLSRVSIRRKKSNRATSTFASTNVEIDSITPVANARRTYRAYEDKNSPLGYSGLPPKIEKLLIAQDFTAQDMRGNLHDAVESASIYLESIVLEDLEEREKVSESIMAAEMAASVNLQKMSPRKKYAFDTGKEFLGKGTFGRVVKCSNKITKVKYALKILKILHLDKIENEIQMHALCGKNANVVHLEEAFVHSKQVFVVLEYMDSGCLSTYLVPNLKWKEKAISFVIYEVLKGLAFMHSHNHLHRDIKSDNILLNSRGEIKLADFGFATNLTKNHDYRQTMLGTPHWMAPEVALRKPYDSKSDIWSLGITMYDIAHGMPPYHSVKPLKAIFLIRTGPPPQLKDLTRWTPEFKDAYRRMMMKDPDQRSASVDLVSHDLFKKEAMCNRKEFANLLVNITDVKTRMKAERSQN